MVKKEKNILILGALGGVANAFLKLISEKYKFKNKFILLDKNYSKELGLEKKYIGLDCECIRQEVVLPQKENEYLDILKKFEIGFVVDLFSRNSGHRSGRNYIGGTSKN